MWTPLIKNKGILRADTSQNEPIKICKVEEFEHSFRSTRAGCILYNLQNDMFYFYLGVDAKSGNLTDFGGGVKKNETVIEGALRELYQETNYLIKLEEDDIKDYYIAYNSFISIIFIHVNFEYDKFKQKFLEKKNNNSELSDIKMLTYVEFYDKIFNRYSAIYTVVRLFLSDLFLRYPNFVSLL